MVFTVIKATSAYNVILGRLAMNAFKVVASTYHKKVKFLIGGWVGEVQGVFATSRKCYVEMVRVDMKRARVEGGV